MVRDARHGRRPVAGTTTATGFASRFLCFFFAAVGGSGPMSVDEAPEVGAVTHLSRDEIVELHDRGYQLRQTFGIESRLDALAARFLGDPESFSGDVALAFLLGALVYGWVHRVGPIVNGRYRGLTAARQVRIERFGKRRRAVYRAADQLHAQNKDLRFDYVRTAALIEKQKLPDLRHPGRTTDYLGAARIAQYLRERDRKFL